MRTKHLIPSFIILFVILFIFYFSIYAMDADTLFKEGTSLIKNSNYVPAINKLEECIEINPEYVGCFCNLAIAYAYQGSLDKAIELMEKAVYKEPLPGRGILFFNLGSIYDSANNKEEAKNNYNYSFYLLPYFSQSYANLGTLYYVNNDIQKGMEYIYPAFAEDHVHARG